jgi:hypothetical protein
MNAGRVIAADLLAGFVLNIGEAALHGALFANATAAAMKNPRHEIVGIGSDTRNSS